MKTPKLFWPVVFCFVFCTATTFGQSGNEGVISPVYIPGKITKDSVTRGLAKFTPVSSIKSTGGNSTIAPNASSNGVVTESCDCNSGCGSCGCNRVGRNFFQELPALGPIKFGLSRDDSCNNRRGIGRFLPTISTNACSRYIGFFGGGVYPQNYNGFVNFGMPMTRQISFNDGAAFGVSFGRRFPNNLRWEQEMVYRQNSANTYSIGNFVGPDFVPTATFDAINQLSSLSFMNNFIYDFKRPGNRNVPYVGFGSGFAWADGDIITPALGRTDSINSDVAWAYQLIGGITRQVTDRLDAFVEYRYRGTSGYRVRDASMQDIDIGRYSYQSSDVLFGFRFTLRNRCCCN